MTSKGHSVGMCVVLATFVAGLIFAPHVQGDRPTECIDGTGYYWETGSGWKPCDKAGPSGDYLIETDCVTCEESGICSPTWYNYPDDGDYVCHIPGLDHVGHEIYVLAEWIGDEDHADVDTTISSYSGGATTWDPHFPLKSGQP